ncbi:MAG: hypothetical protein ACO1OG_09290 [Devosia sp.]
MRALLTAAFLAGLTTAAAAGPWVYEPFRLEDGTPSHRAYQWVEAPEDIAFGYSCDAEWGMESFYIQTPERFADDAPHPYQLPTVFEIDGVVLELMGTPTDQRGQLFIYYSVGDMAETSAFLDRVAAARRAIRINYDRDDLFFSPQGAATALRRAYEACMG